MIGPTPGPWALLKDDRIRTPYRIVSVEGEWLATVQWSEHAEGDPLANARLLAAAPDLLAALKALLSWSTSEYQSHPDIDARARAAIETAEGRT